MLKKAIFTIIGGGGVKHQLAYKVIQSYARDRKSHTTMYAWQRMTQWI